MALVLFGRPFLLVDCSCSSSSSNRVNQMSRTMWWSSSKLRTPSSGMAWKKNPCKSTIQILIDKHSAFMVNSPRELCFLCRSLSRLTSLALRRDFRASWLALREEGWNTFSFLLEDDFCFEGAMVVPDFRTTFWLRWWDQCTNKQSLIDC